MLCKYCEQPIYETELTSGYLGRLVYMRGKYLHMGDTWACDINKINIKGAHYEKPKCHICKTETNVHDSFCSAAGFPCHHAILGSLK